jgi:WD40 repeat protein
MLGATLPGSNPRKVVTVGELAQNEGFDDGGKTVVSSMYQEGRNRIELEWRSVGELTLVRKSLIDGEVDRNAVRAFCGSAGLFASGLNDGLIRVWSARTGKLLHTFGMPDHIDGHPVANNKVNRVAFSPDGSRLAAGMAANTQIALFSLVEDKLLYSLHVRPLYMVVDRRVDPGILAFLGFSADGNILASTDETESSIRLWEARTGREIGRLSGHRDHTVAVAFSPDGKTVASTGGDGTLKLWQLSTRREVATLLEAGAAGPLVFSPDGLMLIVCLRDQARVFRAPALAEIDRGR